MKAYIKEYMGRIKDFIAKDLEKASQDEIMSVLSELEIKTSYFQHERLIHLIVTVLFALMEIMAVLALAVTVNIVPLVLSIMFLVLLVPYVMHYYFLENSVQEFYKLRDKIREYL